MESWVVAHSMEEFKQSVEWLISMEVKIISNSNKNGVINNHGVSFLSSKNEVKIVFLLVFGIFLAILISMEYQIRAWRKDFNIKINRRRATAIR